MLRRLAAAIAVAALHGMAAGADLLVRELEQRYTRDGADAVNEHLVAHWDSAMAPFALQAAACDLQAVSLAIRLSRGGNQRAVLAHTDALRAATGRCARFVLALAPPDEIARYCASVDAWSAARMARELRRRIAEIDADPLLRSGPRGQACRAAYVYEFQNTRVTLKAAPAGPRQGR